MDYFIIFNMIFDHLFTLNLANWLRFVNLLSRWAFSAEHYPGTSRSSSADYLIVLGT